MLLRGLAEEVVYEDSVAQRYAGLLAAVICDGNPTAKREYEHMLAQERQRAKSFGAIGNPLATFDGPKADCPGPFARFQRGSPMISRT